MPINPQMVKVRFTINIGQLNHSPDSQQHIEFLNQLTLNHDIIILKHSVDGNIVTMETDEEIFKALKELTMLAVFIKRIKNQKSNGQI